MAHKKEVPQGKNDFLTFVAMLVLAFLCSGVPFIHWPLSWAETFFHEISHGLTAILTGGRIDQITLHLDGSGWCRSAGGLRFFVVFAGYFGAVVWGALIYIMADSTSEKMSDRIAISILSLIALCIVLWARDPVTWAILILLAVPFAIILKIKAWALENIFLRFAGLYVLLGALKSPLDLLYTETGGDAETLQKMTFLPQIIWVGIWFSFGCIMLLALFLRHARVQSAQDTAIPEKKRNQPKQSIEAHTKQLLEKIRSLQNEEKY